MYIFSILMLSVNLFCPGKDTKQIELPTSVYCEDRVSCFLETSSHRMNNLEVPNVVQQEYIAIVKSFAELMKCDANPNSELVQKGSYAKSISENMYLTVATLKDPYSVDSVTEVANWITKNHKQPRLLINSFMPASQLFPNPRSVTPLFCISTDFTISSAESLSLRELTDGMFSDNTGYFDQLYYIISEFESRSRSDVNRNIDARLKQNNTHVKIIVNYSLDKEAAFLIELKAIPVKE